MSSTVPVSLYLLHVRTSFWFTLRCLETSLDESPSWQNVTIRLRANIAIDLLGMAELQTTRQVYLLPGGNTGADRLSCPLYLIDTAHAWLFPSLCWFRDIDEQSKGLCYWCNINIQHQGILEPKWCKPFFYVCIQLYYTLKRWTWLVFVHSICAETP